MTPVKEVHYFDKRHLHRRDNQFYRSHLRKRMRRYRRLDTYRKAIRPGDSGFVRNLRWDAHFFLPRRDNAWYRGVFRPEPGQIAGEITPRDYPRHLRDAGIGGVVGVLFRVDPPGLVSRCSITQSSGVPELDALTCRLIVQRFRYRPSTDRYGRPIADNVEGDHEWIPHGR